MSTNVMRVGNVEIVALVDAEAKVPPAMMFPTLAKEAWGPYCEFLVDDCVNLPLTIPTFILRSGGKTILIDSGIGAKNRPLFPNGRLPEALAEAGLRPE